MMVSLAHLSDIHLAPLPALSWRSLFSKRITGYINWQLNRNHGNDHLDKIIADIKLYAPDHIAITGDLVNLGLKDEVIAAQKWLATLGNTQDISIIPGNHDSYVRGSLNHAQEVWRDYMPVQDHFPYLRRKDELAIIGVSSAEASLPFLSIGRFRQDQAERLAHILQQTKKENLFRIILIHHPPFRYKGDAKKRLYGIRLFQNVVQTHGAELILHGHTHKSSFQTIASPAIPVIGVSSASSPHQTSERRACWNLFNIERSNQGWNCTWRERNVDINGRIMQTDERELIKNSKTINFKS